MDMYDHDRDTLEDILYRRLQDLWAPLTDSMKVFNENGAAQPLCAQKVWEALLTAFPLDHKRMQTALLARELARMMRWDGDSKRAINFISPRSPNFTAPEQKCVDRQRHSGGVPGFDVYTDQKCGKCSPGSLIR